MRVTLTTLIAVCILCGASQSQPTEGAPNLINYSGNLSDAAGNPVPDGTYMITFNVYDSAIGGINLWTSTSRPVTTSGGIFSYVLGSFFPLPHLFDSDLFLDTTRYLGITVGADPEMSPRTRFTSVPYAIKARNSADSDSLGGSSPDSYRRPLWSNIINIPAGFADGVDDNDHGITESEADLLYVHTTGDIMTGLLRVPEIHLGEGGVTSGKLLFFHALSAAGRTLSIESFLDGHTMTFSDFSSGIQRRRLRLSAFGGSGTVVLFRNDDDSIGIQITGNSGSDQPLMRITGSDRSANFVMAVPGNSSVQLPTNSIANDEILDEPGISIEQTSANIILVQSNTSQDILAVTITVPSAGYVAFEANVFTSFSLTTGKNYSWYQLTNQSGAIKEPNGGFQWVGSSAHGDLGNNYQQTNVKKVLFFSSAGPRTFYLQGNAWTGNNVAAASVVVPPTSLQATYYPTAYGSVSTLASTPGDHPDAKAVSITGIDGSVSTAYKMDLRYYEDKARAARIAEQKAELARIEAELELAGARGIQD